MDPDYRQALGIQVQRKKREIPTAFSEKAVAHIFAILESTPAFLSSLAKRFDAETSREPIAKGKRSFRETLVHMLNIEGLNYTTLYPAFLLDKPTAYPIHAERHFAKLGLFSGFGLDELLAAFRLERAKSLGFLHGLDNRAWQRRLIEPGKKDEVTIYKRARDLALHDFTHARILEFQTGYRG